jgi:dolichol-phosphate mannosyltransferase
MRIAVVNPAHNEAGNIGRLLEETVAAVPEASLQEVIVVDDASDDGTGPEIKAMLGRYKPRYLRHGRCAGQSAALRSGLREGRKAKGSRKAASRFANWIRDKVLADGCPDTGCGLKVYRRTDYLVLPYFTSTHEVAYEPVNDRPRLKGASNTPISNGPDWAIKACQLAPQADTAPADWEDLLGADSAGGKARSSQVKVGSLK